MDILTFDTSFMALLFSMAVYVGCRSIRLGFELVLPVLKEATKAANIWRLFILPTMPVVFGGLVGGLIDTYPYPAGLVSRPTHVMYGMVCGFAAGWAYRILKAVVERKWDVELPADPPNG
jgi:hypothetical protein